MNCRADYELYGLMNTVVDDQFSSSFLEHLNFFTMTDLVCIITHVTITITKLELISYSATYHGVVVNRRPLVKLCFEAMCSNLEVVVLESLTFCKRCTYDGFLKTEFKFNFYDVKRIQYRTMFLIFIFCLTESRLYVGNGCFVRYQFRNEKRVGLQELGPRFTLRPRSLQKGTFDSKSGEYYWVFKVFSALTVFLTNTFVFCML
jgi:hypothetical protein